MRLINADALIEKCGNWYVEEGTESGFIGTLKNLLAIQPTVQPEIIRCKDCKHRDKYGCCKYWKGLAMADIPIATDDNDFCCYAE